MINFESGQENCCKNKKNASRICLYLFSIHACIPSSFDVFHFWRRKLQPAIQQNRQRRPPAGRIRASVQPYVNNYQHRPWVHLIILIIFSFYFKLACIWMFSLSATTITTSTLWLQLHPQGTTPPPPPPPEKVYSAMAPPDGAIESRHPPASPRDPPRCLHQYHTLMFRPL